MAGDQFQGIEWPAQFECRALRHIAVRGAVKSIAADIVFLVEGVGQGVMIGEVRYGLVERGIEYGDLRYVGQQFLTALDAHVMVRVMERRKHE